MTTNTDHDPSVAFERAYSLGFAHGIKSTNLIYQTDFLTWETAQEYLRGFNQGRRSMGKDGVSAESFAAAVGIKNPANATSEEVRTTSPTGGQKGVKPQRHSLIPIEALDTMARLYGFGAEKYAAHNWRKGYDWSKSFDSLIRHANAFWGGQDLDEETGLPHLAGAAFHCFTLMVFMQEHPEFDDRYKAEKVKSVADRLIEEVQGRTIPNPRNVFNYFDGTTPEEPKKERLRDLHILKIKTTEDNMGRTTTQSWTDGYYQDIEEAKKARDRLVADYPEGTEISLVTAHFSDHCV